MTSSDKDFRFMATNDLMSELQKDNIKLDDDSERKVVRMLLKVKMREHEHDIFTQMIPCFTQSLAKVEI